MQITVAEAMSRDIITVQPETPLSDAIKILAEKRISGLPVLNNAGELIGIISESDLMWQETGVTPPAYIMLLDSVIYLQNPAKHEQQLHKALGQTVGEVMTNHPITIAPEQPLQAAARILHDKNIHRLPVVDDTGNVIGILTQGDIIRAMAASQS